MFHCLKRDTRKALWNAHNTYLSNIFTTSLEKNNSSIFWRYVKRHFEEPTGVAPLKHDGQLHSRSKDKAEILCDQFKSVLTQDDGGVISQLEGHANPSIDRLHICCRTRQTPPFPEGMQSIWTRQHPGQSAQGACGLFILTSICILQPLTRAWGRPFWLEISIHRTHLQEGKKATLPNPGPQTLSASVPYMHLFKIARACDMQAHPWPPWAT